MIDDGGAASSMWGRVFASVGSVSGVSCESSVRGLPPFLMVFFGTTYTMMMLVLRNDDQQKYMILIQHFFDMPCKNLQMTIKFSVY